MSQHSADELPLSQAGDTDADDVVEVIYDEREDGLLHVFIYRLLRQSLGSEVLSFQWKTSGNRCEYVPQ